MDPISYGVAAKQKQRIEQVIANPDSTSGIVTTPSVIATGETITIPTGRTAILPNTTVNGTLDVQGEVFIPSGSSYTDTEVDATVVKQNGSVVAVDSAVVHNTGNEVVAGIKTFSNFPLTPSSNPTQNYEVANKKYVDDTAGISSWVTNDSRVKTALNATGSAPIYACRAWVNFNGSGTVAIRASGNVSSITDNGVGDYTVNFTTAMPDANYSILLSGKRSTSSGYFHSTVISNSQAKVLTYSGTAGATEDYAEVFVAIFR